MHDSQEDYRVLKYLQSQSQMFSYLFIWVNGIEIFLKCVGRMKKSQEQCSSITTKKGKKTHFGPADGLKKQQQARHEWEKYK
ncbi:CLUMA_CG011002, isoform A [Clunio marinus]|uniref:CLUMA_CG011002, isoform A n=1 Tax=Clunio marinus TaxID=568069 RepID=A0A1J1IBK0_9DIPT|nr:CLUMA_CG011002, isoform A [Clunio marinus]